MRTSPRRRLARLAVTTVAAITALVAPLAHPVPGVLAGGVCPDGTNWDNSIHACR